MKWLKRIIGDLLPGKSQARRAASIIRMADFPCSFFAVWALREDTAPDVYSKISHSVMCVCIWPRALKEDVEWQAQHELGEGPWVPLSVSDARAIEHDY